MTEDSMIIAKPAYLYLLNRQTRFIWSQLLVLLLVMAPKQSTAQLGVADPSNGYVSEGIYTNEFFDFTYKIPQDLIPLAPQFKEHSIDPSRPSAKHFALFVAAKSTKPYQNIAIQAEGTAGFRDEADYLAKVASTAAKIGLTVLNSPEKKNISGETFFRQDNYSPKGSFYQTHVCTVSKGYVLDFVLSANNRADIERLFNSLNKLQFGSIDK
jgi:hypothetical protein